MKIFLPLLISLLSFLLQAQNVDFTLRDFNLTGSAMVLGETTIMLTDNLLWEGGAMWYKEDIDLNNPFTMELEVYFGCSDGGADGIVFMLHPKLSTGFRGEGMGFGGLYPSFGVEMDTYQNFHLDDPHFDHVALMAHGTLRHQYGLTDPVPLDPDKGNVENCDYHMVKVLWNPKTQYFTFLFDKKERIRQKIDLVGGVFEGNPNVYWGFGSATGRKRNKHMVKLKKLEFTENNTLKYEDQSALIAGEPYILRKLNFASGSTKLPDSAKPELDKLMEFHKRYPNHTIILDGFTDSSGNESSNLKISEKRAEAIAKYMISQGFPENRLLHYGNGESNPIDSNETEEGRENNRRVEVRMKVIKV